MYSQNKGIPHTNNILQIKGVIFYPTGGGELTLPNNNKTLPEATIPKSISIETPTVQKGRGQRQESSSVNSQVIQFCKNFDAYLRPYLEYKVKVFRGGQISNYLTHLKSLTSDKTILSTVVGDTIEYVNQPPEISIIPKNPIAKEHAEQVFTELSNPIDKKVNLLLRMIESTLSLM